MMRIPPRWGALIAIVIWGASFVATKIALRSLEPIALVSARTVLGAAFLAVLVARSRRPMLPPRGTWPNLALMGFVGVFFHQMIQAYGLRLTSATNTGWLIGLVPIWTAALAAVFLRERFGRGKVLGLLTGFAGALLVVTRGRFGGETVSLPSTRGDLLILASTLNWAVYTVLGHGTIRRLGSLVATTGAVYAGGIMMLPFLVASGEWHGFAHLSWTTFLAVVFLGVGSSGLGYFFWYGALERIEASRVAAFLYLEPLVTLVTAMALLDERAPATTIAGGVILLTGVLMVQRAK